MMTLTPREAFALLAAFVVVVSVALVGLRVNDSEWSGVLQFMETAFTGALAYYALNSFREARFSSERQLRAYMFVESATCRLGTNKVGVKLKFKNFGATPASNVEIRFALFPEKELPTLGDIKPNLAAPFAPTDTRTISDAKPVDAFFPVEQRGKIHVLGRIDYTDSFGAKRWTNFKMRYVESATTSDAGLEATADGNDFS